MLCKWIVHVWAKADLLVLAIRTAFNLADKRYPLKVIQEDVIFHQLEERVSVLAPGFQVCCSRLDRLLCSWKDKSNWEVLKASTLGNLVENAQRAVGLAKTIHLFIDDTLYISGLKSLLYIQIGC